MDDRQSERHLSKANSRAFHRISRVIIDNVPYSLPMTSFFRSFCDDVSSELSTVVIILCTRDTSCSLVSVE